MAVYIEQLNDDDTDTGYDLVQQLIIRKSAVWNSERILVLHLPEPEKLDGNQCGLTYKVDAKELLSAIRRLLRN